MESVVYVIQTSFLGGSTIRNEYMEHIISLQGHR